MTERTLDRIAQFDERSRDFNVREITGMMSPRSFTWKVPVWLDQGSDGACVGFSWAQEAAGRPVAVPGIDNKVATDIYQLAKTLDGIDGEAYSGTSVLAGAKAMQQKNFLGEYRWAFSLIDALAAISHHGPAVVGINWREAMFTPDADGLIHPLGPVVGGHAILVNGVDVKRHLVRFHNSWGKGWGLNGEALMPIEEFDMLRTEGGEVCIPITRGWGGDKAPK